MALGGGLAVIDRQMIERELADGRLQAIAPVELTGPYSYWLDVANDKQGLASSGSANGSAGSATHRAAELLCSPPAPGRSPANHTRPLAGGFLVPKSR